MSSKTPFSQILERSAILRRHCDVTRQGPLFVARAAVFACGDGYLLLLERPALAISPFLYSLHERPFARSPLPRFFAFAERPGGPLRRGLFTYPCRAFPNLPWRSIYSVRSARVYDPFLDFAFLTEVLLPYGAPEVHAASAPHTWRPGALGGQCYTLAHFVSQRLGAKCYTLLEGVPKFQVRKYAHCRGPEKRKGTGMLRDSRKKCDVQQFAGRFVASAGHSPLTASCPP